MGLARSLWPKMGVIQAELSLSDQDCVTLFAAVKPPFVWWRPWASRDRSDTQPHHVADALDRWLAERQECGT